MKLCMNTVYVFSYSDGDLIWKLNWDKMLSTDRSNKDDDLGQYNQISEAYHNQTINMIS